ncbi:MAG: TonB-dependent receptor [Bacteroidetes bacterium]|nr:TonB-dependent receptor [Bacteroidota bacterium]
MKKTIKIIAIFLAITAFITVSTSAQTDKQKQKVKGSGKITGKVFDKETAAPLTSATVQVFKMKDSSKVTGAETDDQGSYSMDVPYGRYRVIISYISYSSAIYNGVVVNATTPTQDVGTTNLSSSITSTQVIEVTAEKDFMETSIDKKVFNIEQSLITQGGTATDVLKTIPSVTVDADGNVSLRGNSNVKFLVDGRPSGMIGTDPTNALQQISANTIERVEVIDNPSAKYDPDGTSGIINIIMKKTEEAGYNGNVSVNAGTKDKYNTSLNLNYKNKNLNVYGSYNFRLFNMHGNGNTFRQNNFGDSTFYFDQNSLQHFNMQGNMGTLGFDYSLSNNDKISLSGTYNNRQRSIDQTLHFNQLDGGMSLTSLYDRNNYEKHTGNGLDVTLSYDHKFSIPKEDLSAAVYYSSNKDDEVLNANQQNYDLGGNPLGNPILQNTYTNGKYQLGSFQLDYYYPLGDVKGDSRIEVGYKGTLRNTSSDFRSENYDYVLGAFVTENNLTNNFQYKEQIHSFYGLYANGYKDFKYQLGIRLEEALTKPELLSANQNYDNNYFSFFPSFYLSQKFATTNELQLNYSRRINRPNLYMLNPFIDYSDPYNLRQGNPYLKPEYVNSFQFSYIKYLSFASVTGSLFYKQINDMMSRIVTVYPDGVSLTSFQNLNNAKSYGAELTTSGHPFKWWNFNADLTYFRMIISGNDNAALNNDNYSYTAKLMNNFSIAGLFDLQVSYNYQGPTVLAQGRMDPIQSFDIAIKKDILNGRGSLGFRVSDLFNQQRYVSETSGPGFVQDMTRVRDSRAAFLTFSYRFGTDGKQQPKKDKPKNNEEENNDNGDY